MQMEFFTDVQENFSRDLNNTGTCSSKGKPHGYYKGRVYQYLNKAQNRNSVEKGIPHQWSQGVFFALYAWNAGTLDGTYISR